jgi:hypothetical protein
LLRTALLSLALVAPASSHEDAARAAIALALAGRPAPEPVPAAEPDYQVYKWFRVTGKPGWWGLWDWDTRDTWRQVGAWNENTGVYRPLHADGCWGPACEPPEKPPKKRAAAQRPVLYYQNPPPVYYPPPPAFFGPPVMSGGGCGPGRG